MNGVRATNPKVSILTYHSIDDSGSVVSTSRKTFQKQMRSLSESSCNVISLNAIMDCLHENRPLPSRALAITFDDGYRNVYTEAFPILEKYGFGATVFLISDYCGKDNDWPGNSPAFERRPLLSWSEIEEMRRHGFEFGAHTATHPDLTRVSIQQAEREITGSKAEIEDRLGVEARCFAYPYGKYNSEVQEIVRTQFPGACSTKLGKVRSDCDPHALRRIDMYYLSHPALYGSLEADALEWYLGARQILRDLKARLI